MASSRAIILFFAATIFVDQALSLSSYEAERQARKRAALANELDDNKDPGDVNSLRRCVRALAGDVVAMRRSLRDMRRSDPGAFNANMGQMQENEMQMQLMLDTDDLQNGGNFGQYPPGTQINGYPNSPFANPQNSPYGAYDQQPQQLQPPQQFQQPPQYSPFQQFQQPDQSPYGYPPNSGAPMNPMGMPGNHAYPNNQMEAMRRLLNGNNASPELGHKPHSGNRPGPHLGNHPVPYHGRSLHSRSALAGNRAY